MTIRFFEDMVSRTGLKVNSGRVVKHVSEGNRPLLPISRRGGRDSVGL